MELDFLVMMTTTSVLVYLLLEVMRFLTPSVKDVNLAFSLETFTAFFVLFYLLKQAFEGGIFASDESKVALFLGAQGAMVAFVLLYITPQYVDFAMPQAFEAFIRRVNQCLAAIDMHVELGYEYFCGLMAGLAALITIAQTKHAVDFGHYYHSFTKTAWDKTWQNLGYRVTGYRKFQVQMHLAFLLPILIVVTFVQSIMKSFFAPKYISEGLFDLLRLALIAVYIGVKASLSRREIQWGADQSYGYIKALPYNTNDQFFQTMTNRMLSTVNGIWTTVLGHFGCLAIPILLVVLLLHKGCYFFCSPTMPAINFDFLYTNVTGMNETTINAGQSPLSNETRVKTNPYAAENMAGIFSEVNSKGLVPGVFYRALLEFLAFWWVLSYFAITVFALLYYRRFQSQAATAKQKIL